MHKCACQCLLYGLQQGKHLPLGLQQRLYTKRKYLRSGYLPGWYQTRNQSSLRQLQYRQPNQNSNLRKRFLDNRLLGSLQRRRHLHAGADAKLRQRRDANMLFFVYLGYLHSSDKPRYKNNRCYCQL